MTYHEAQAEARQIALTMLKERITNVINNNGLVRKDVATAFGMRPDQLSAFMNTSEKGISSERLLKMEQWLVDTE